MTSKRDKSVLKQSVCRFQQPAAIQQDCTVSVREFILASVSAHSLAIVRLNSLTASVPVVGWPVTLIVKFPSAASSAAVSHAFVRSSEIFHDNAERTKASVLRFKRRATFVGNVSTAFHADRQARAKKKPTRRNTLRAFRRVGLLTNEPPGISRAALYLVFRGRWEASFCRPLRQRLSYAFPEELQSGCPGSAGQSPF